MRRTRRLLISLLALTAFAATTAAQQPHTSETDDYSIELPSETWKAVPRADNAHRHTEFIYGERSNGYLRLRKEVVEGNTSLSDFARAEQDTKHRFLPAFVGGKEERFTGRLNGIVTTYEYTSGGKPMAGRVYYLQADNRTVYALHFTGLRDKMELIHNQTDAIARSFKLKQ
jgi:Ni/Co efflux regulator RcnB